MLELLGLGKLGRGDVMAPRPYGSLVGSMGSKILVS